MSQPVMRERPERPAGHTVLLPDGWQRPRGYANGILARGEFVFVGGMIGWDESQRFADGFVAQAKQALANIVAVLRKGGAAPEHVVRLTWYVVDRDEYLASLKEIGEAYRGLMGKHYPAMSVVQVSALVESQARLEIEATAVVP